MVYVVNLGSILQLPDLAVIKRMKEKLQKRGPDSEGSYISAPIALVFKCMIYNYPDLRAAS